MDKFSKILSGLGFLLLITLAYFLYWVNAPPEEFWFPAFKIDSGRVLQIFGAMFTCIGLFREERLKSWRNDIINKVDGFTTIFASWSCSKFIWPIGIVAIGSGLLYLFVQIFGKAIKNFTPFYVSIFVIYGVMALAFIFVALPPLLTYGLIIPIFWLLLLPYVFMHWISKKSSKLLGDIIAYFGVLITITGVIISN